MRRRAASTAARSRPTRFPCGRSRTALRASRRGGGWRRSAPRRRRGFARRSPRIPRLVAGAGRFDTEAMTILGARAFTKTGAEGAYCAALPELGLGLAVKADDGGGRAAQVMIAALLRRFGAFDEALNDRLAPFVAPRLRNWSAVDVGALRPAGPLTDRASDGFGEGKGGHAARGFRGPCGSVAREGSRRESGYTLAQDLRTKSARSQAPCPPGALVQREARTVDRRDGKAISDDRAPPSKARWGRA